MCAQVAPAYGLRDSRTHPDEIIEALIKEKNEGKLDTTLNTRIRRNYTTFGRGIYSYLQ